MPVYRPPFLATTKTGLRSYFLYEYRKWYKEKTSEIFEASNPNYIDLWYDVPFYGKVDTFGKLVIPNKEKMVYPLNNQTQIIGFDFMIKAVNEYLFFLQRGSLGGKTELQSLLNNFKVKTGFVDIVDFVINQNVISLEAFNSLAYENKYIKKQITDFKTYMCQVVNFFTDVEQDFTLFKFFSSQQGTLKSTGLCFEFSTESHDDDLPKNKYFQSPEFYKYIQSAANFGFRVNKNAPWMLVADIASKPMLEGRTVKRGYVSSEKKLREVHVDGYIQENFIPNLEVFFSEYYQSAMEYSFYLFLSSILAGYVEYKNNIRYIVEPGDIKVTINKYSKIFTGAGVNRKKEIIKNVSSLSNTTFDLLIAVEQFEKLLKSDFRYSYDKSKYNKFKKRFKKILNSNTNEQYTKSIEFLEDFYTPVKLYNPKTKKLDWNSPKNNLTPLKSYDSLQTKDKPTHGKVVTEFIADI